MLDGHGGNGHVNVTTGGLGVRAEVMRERGELVGGVLVHALNGRGQRHGEAHAAVGEAEVHSGFCGARSALDLMLASHELQRAVKAGAVAGGEELLWVGGTALAAVIRVLFKGEIQATIGV